MMGLMTGSTFVTPMTLAEKIVIVINIGAVVIIAALGFLIYWGFRKTKSPEKSQNNKNRLKKLRYSTLCPLGGQPMG